MRIWILLSFTLISFLAHTASRVGGGKLSNDGDQYEMPMPGNFSDYEIYGEVVRLKGPIVVSLGFNIPALIQVSRFIDLSPVGSSSREVIFEFYENNEWQYKKHNNFCIDIYSKETSSAVTYIAVWGNDKGVILTGQKNSLVENAIEEMLNKIELLPGACSWK